jgi:hypothetical protein
LLFKEGQFVDYIEEGTITPGQYFPVVCLQNSGHEVRFTTITNPKKLVIPSHKDRARIKGQRRLSKHIPGLNSLGTNPWQAKFR